MPVTYNLIASNTLTTSAASVTFSAIPNTFTDLVIRASIRRSSSVVDANLFMTVNSDTGTNYSVTYLQGNGSTATSSRETSTTWLYGVSGANGNSSTSNTFSNVEIYIPSYTASQNKPVAVFSAVENNATNAVITANADLWRSTSAITSISFTGNDFLSGSSFFLYGIKNS